ncbi:MAG: YoaK family protein [Kofleriaceae bacterium]
MFRHEAETRSFRLNQILAAYLAAIAGIVNSAGFVLIGSFTSHVTGNVGRFADDLAMSRSAAPLFALFLVIAFFAGAFIASMAIESSVERRPRTYAILLFVEAGLLAAFALLSYLMDTHDPRFRDVQGVLLCMAMGMQNSFVTRLSGAVVRTTHLTGVMTDLAIDAARWFRLWRARVGLVVGDAPTATPSREKSLLLLTILGSFIAGSVIGALAAVKWDQLALLLPTIALAVGGVYALASTIDRVALFKASRQ